jgi:cytochrome c-type biogenesis protein CcsB
MAKRKKSSGSGRHPALRILLSLFFSMPGALALGLIFAVSIAAATFIEARSGSEAARAAVYGAAWFEVLLALIGLNLAANLVRYRMWRRGKTAVFLFHLGFLLILAGAGVTRHYGFSGSMHIREGGTTDMVVPDGNAPPVRLPFSLRLNDFRVDRYPGSMRPSGFTSDVTVVDSVRGVETAASIFMNHILRHRGYRFYQTSYDDDEAGTVLTVTRDPGMFPTYAGYFLLGLAMIANLFRPGSRFRSAAEKTGGKRAAGPARKTSGKPVRKPAPKSGGKTARKPAGKRPGSRGKRTAAAAALMIGLAAAGGPATVRASTDTPASTNANASAGAKGSANPDASTDAGVPAGVRVAGPSEVAGPSGSDRPDAGPVRRFSGLAVQDGQGRIKPVLSMAFEKMRSEPGWKAVRRNDADRLALRLFLGAGSEPVPGLPDDADAEGAFRLFPVPGDAAGRWITAETAAAAIAGGPEGTADSAAVFAVRWAADFREAGLRRDWKTADSLVSVLASRQSASAGRVHRGGLRLNAETLMLRLDPFSRLAPAVLGFGLLLLALRISAAAFPRLKPEPAGAFLTAGLIACFGLMTGGLVLRWIASGHAPWTNKYESMIFIAWSVLLAGTLFGLRNRVAAAASGVLAGLILCAGRSAAFDPKITALPPVLKSVWLIIHVSVITSSYGFLGLGGLLALFNLLLTAFAPGRTARPAVEHQTPLIERLLLAGLTLLVIGNFLGAVWANESWGRYWGWDPKETWTLVTILLYAMVLHFRTVPRLAGPAVFNAGAMWAFGSVLMTYFGVNLYLSGMHSYASGGRPGVPAAVFISAGLAAAVTAVALVRGRRSR